MKKLLVVAMVAMSLVACNEAEKTETTTTTESKVVTENAAVDGEYMMRDGKVVVMKGGEWIVITEPVTLSNGTVVKANGEVKNADGVTVTLGSGQKVNNSGVVVTANGDNVFQDVGDGVKKGVNEAGDAIKTGAQKTGEAVKKGVNKAGEGIKKAGQEIKEVVQ